jgi:hypothetical protein
MIHIHAVCPADTTVSVVEALAQNPGVMNLIVQTSACPSPSRTRVSRRNAPDPPRHRVIVTR